MDIVINFIFNNRGALKQKPIETATNLTQRCSVFYRC